jgi:hypothetical protein
LETANGSRQPERQMMEKPTYYILEGEEVKGPFTLGQICSMWSSGELLKDTLYSEEGYDKWLQLRLLMEEDDAARATTVEQWSTTSRREASYGPAEYRMYRMESTGGVLDVFEDKIAITPAGIGILVKGLKGTKTIPYFSITAIQFKRAGLMAGYLQFSIHGGKESTGGIWQAAADENTFMFADNDGRNNRTAELIKTYVEKRIREVRSPVAPAPAASGGMADEIKKLADLKAQGILSDEEFQTAKARLLAG